MPDQMIYWLNVNRPDMQFRTNGVTSWQRKLNEKNWRYHDGQPLAFPSEWRYGVTEQELEDQAREGEKA